MKAQVTKMALSLIFFFTSFAIYSADYVELNKNDFRPQAEINWRLAHFSAHTALVAYEDSGEGSVFYFMKKYGFRNLVDIDDMSFYEYGALVNLQAYVYYRQKFVDGKVRNQVVIAFRGTKGVSDIITDLSAIGKTNFANGSVHRGFYASVKHFEDIINSFPNYSQIIRNPDTQILITGHSLGGSIAELYGAKLIKDRIIKKNQLNIYTIGQAAVGDSKYVDDFKNAMYYHRMYHSNDPILATDNVSLNYLDNGIKVDLKGKLYKGGHSSKHYVDNLSTYSLFNNLSTTWNGNGSIINNVTEDLKGKSISGYGLTEDITNTDATLANKSFNSFQWQVNTDNGKYLKISSSTEGDLVATVCYSSWSGKSAQGHNLNGKKYCYSNVTLPFYIDPTRQGYTVSDGKWFVVGVSANGKTNDTLTATPSHSDGYINNTASAYLSTIDIDGTHIWTGTGSLINYTSKGIKDYGLSYDIAHLKNNDISKINKSAVLFQWEVNRVTGTSLKFTSNCATRATISFGSWGNRRNDIVYNDVKLPFIINDITARIASNGDWFVSKVKVTEAKSICNEDANGLWVRAEVVN